MLELSARTGLVSDLSSFDGEHLEVLESAVPAVLRKRYPNKPTTAEWLPSALERHRDTLRVQDFTLAARMVANTLEGTIHATLDHNPELILTQEFIDELHVMLVRYLKKMPGEGIRND